MMIKKYTSFALLFFLLLVASNVTAGKIKGIYITQDTLENTARITHLIKHAKAAGVNTFVVDLEIPSKKYRDNIGLVKDNNLRYVARIVIFPDGGSHAQVTNPEIWQRKYRLVKQAIDWGASEIQLDYIRYKSSQKPSSENAKRIHTIIQWYKTKVAAANIPLQVDVFGITSFGESKWIGQNVKLFAPSVDALCPMVYPSHYEPFAEHYRTPYQTVATSLKSLKGQFNNQIPFKLYAYIELSNYHYPKMSRAQKLEYIKAQLRAVETVGTDGWFAWSPHNQYENLFYILGSGNIDEAKNTQNKPQSQSLSAR